MSTSTSSLVSVLCPYCQAGAELEPGFVVGIKHPWVWLCAPCKAWVKVWENSVRMKPMGRLAKADLRDLHLRARQVLADLCRYEAQARGWPMEKAVAVAHRWLAEQMAGFGFRGRRSIPFMDEAGARQVIALCASAGQRRAA